MTAQEALQKYQVLEQQRLAGRLSESDYREAVGQLKITGPDGRTWGLQPFTGLWFIFRDGRWEAAPLPEPAATRSDASYQGPAEAPAQPQQAAPSTTVQAPPTSRRTGYAWMLGGVGLLVACMLCGLVAGAGYLIYNGTIPVPGIVQAAPSTPTPGEQPPVPVEEITLLETVAVSPDGVPQTDSRGVTLVVPAGAVEANEQVNLLANELQAPWREAIEQVVTLETPFYQLAASGKSDAPGSLNLSFPASNPNARLLAVIDGEFLVELDQVPQAGKLIIESRAGPTDSSELKPPEGYDGTGSIYYAVITPKAASEQQGTNRLAALISRQGDERSCIPDLSIIGGAAINLCRQNEAGTIHVMLPTLLRDLRPQVDSMVDMVEAVMSKYAAQGFTTAQLSKSRPMLIRVSAKVKDPTYYPANGVLYIPQDTVRDIATKTPTDVYHEMAHWIQSVKYSTVAAYWSGPKTWWLEVAAENMVMLVEPSYLAGNLTTYGTISTAAETLAFQNEPYQWPGDFYIHAQLLKVNLCDSAVCPLSPASFAQAISEGRYPIDGTAKSLISGNLKDYAFYLLGKSPSAANTGMALSGPVKSGEGYGEFVQVQSDPSIDHKYLFNGRAPQMTMGQRDGRETMEINASLQRDSVYPLMVLGGEGKNPGLPVELVIEPGASFYYTLDDGELKYSDGSKELILRPIHGKMGIRKVRIIAMGINGGETFKAHLQTLNLEGAWVVMVTGKSLAGTTTCSDDSVKTDNPDGTAVLMAYILGMAGGTGDMKLDSTGRNLDWIEVAGRAPAEFKEAGVTFKASVLLSGDVVKFQGAVDLPRQEGESSHLPGLPLALAWGCLPLVWLFRRWLGPPAMRAIVNILVIGTLALVSAGCFGMGMYGSAAVDARFDKIEFLDGQDTGTIVLSNELSQPQGKPIWKLTGTGVYDTVFMIETTTVDLEGKEDTEITTCTGKMTYPVTAYVYRDVSLSIKSGD